MISREKVFWLKGCAGLGNRLHTLSSAIEYSKATHRTLFVDWTDGQFAPRGENAFFNVFELRGLNYFSSAENMGVIEEKNIYPKIWAKSPSSRVYDLFEGKEISNNGFLKIPKKFIPKGEIRKIYGYWRSKKIQVSERFSCLPPIFNSETLLMSSDYKENISKPVVIGADFCPELKKTELKKHLVIKKRILKIVNDFFSKNSLEKNSVGVHVRNTDKKPSCDIVNLVNYLQTDKYKDKSILLCTDNPETEALFKKKIDGVFVYKKSIDLDSAIPPHRLAYENEGVDKSMVLEDSIIDMCLLANSDELLYQGNSSFSRLALYFRCKGKSDDWTKMFNGAAPNN